MKWDDLRPGDILVNDEGELCWLIIGKRGSALTSLSLLLDDHFSTVDLDHSSNGRRLGDGVLSIGWKWSVNTEGRCCGET